jgi:hypothetical protein
MATQLSYEQWMKQVDREVETRAGLSVHDLADCNFRDWYEDDVPPRTAAVRAIRYSGGE